jgi:hypothetical protein
MNVIVPKLTLLLMVLCVACAPINRLSPCARAQETTPKRIVNRLDAVRTLDEVEKEWRQRITTSEEVKRADSRSIWAAKNRILISILRERFKSNDAKREVARIVAEANASEFVDDTFNALIYILTFDGDRAGLVDLLSQQCLPRIAYSDVEYWLVVQTPPKIADGFLILCDAFEASHSAIAKKEIAAALRRSLDGLNVQSNDDDKMVQLSRRWYLAHRHEYTPDLQYDTSQRHQNVLFVKKNNAR